ncbi:MAG: TonB-dependent receptor [Prevotella sp.]|nr:TonB-dependent receptor [Prevotella sp.]
MKRRLTMILAGLFLSLGIALAQTKVTGTVVSADDGQPVIGASVLVVGTNDGTVTDVNGKFSLTVPAGKKMLKVSYVGMIEETVEAKNGMRIILASDVSGLDEVMVVAYGTQKKSSFTGSAAVVGSDEIGKVQVTNVADALKGKVAGVQLTNASGAPGQTSPSIRIRGINSVNAGNSPLYVVDGVPFEGDLNNINPQDIESMTVLKDAASTALYGARGANGIILITTKKGRQGTSSITVDAKWGSNSKGVPEYEYIKSPAKHYEMWYLALNNYAKDKLGYADAQAYVWANKNVVDNTTFGLGYNVYDVPEGQYLIGMNGKLNPNATLGRHFTYNGQEYTLMPDDWNDAVYNNSLRQEYSVTANATTDRSSFYASVNYLDNEGITPNSQYDRLTGRLKADYQVKPWLKVGGNFSYTHFEADQTNPDYEGASNSSGNVFAMSMMAPIYSVYVRDGEGNIMHDNLTNMPMYDYGDGTHNGVIRPYLKSANPLSANQLDKNNYNGNAFNVSGFAEIRFLKDFKFTTSNSVYIDETRQTNTINPYYGQYASSNGIVYKYHTRSVSQNYLQQLDWRKKFGEHNIEVMVAHENYKYEYSYLYGSKSNQFSPNNDELASAVVAGSANSYRSDYNTEGWLSRALYNYNDKYFASASFRRDASSRFHKDNRWGNFWSFGGAWLINKEKFFNVSWIDELKIKASYGENGNDNIGSFRYATTYSIENSNDQVALVPSALGNKDISWETVGTFNAGVEFSMFKGRLSGGIEFYNKKTTDMLFYFNLPQSYGFGGYYDNIGNMTNRGVELELRGDIIRTKDLTWSVYGNIATNKNEITYLPEENKTAECDGVKGYVSGAYFIGEGESMYTLRMIKYAGVDPETGVALYWKDVLDADGNVTGQETTDNPSYATYHLCGTAMPDAYGGFGTSLEWKGFDFSADFSYQLGGQVWDSDYQSAMSAEVGHVIHRDMLNAWSATNTSSNIPRWQYNDEYMASSSDRWLISSNYLSLNNVTLGYTLPMNLTAKIGISKLRVYVVGDNLWVWSKRQGLDPRQSISGGAGSSYYSAVRTISGGVTLTF